MGEDHRHGWVSEIQDRAIGTENPGSSAKLIFNNYFKGIKEYHKAVKRLKDLEDNLDPETVRRLSDQSKAAGGEQYRPRLSDKNRESTPQPVSKLRHNEILSEPSKSSIMAELREEEKRTPQLRQELAAGHSPSALISAALDLENSQ